MRNTEMWKPTENETVTRPFEESSSELKDGDFIETKELPGNATGDFIFLAGETSERQEKLVVPFLDISRQREWEKKQDAVVSCLFIKMVGALRFFEGEESSLSYAEKLVYEIESEYSARILGEVLLNIYMDYNDYSNIQEGICRILGHFELREVKPWGPTMLMGLLNHKSEQVKEAAVAVVENWADTELLPSLRNLDCASKWLKEYIDDVVQYLEKCDALHKKAV